MKINLCLVFRILIYIRLKSINHQNFIIKINILFKKMEYINMSHGKIPSIYIIKISGILDDINTQYQYKMKGTIPLRSFSTETIFRKYSFYSIGNITVFSVRQI
jgi:hypothetical protein